MPACEVENLEVSEYERLFCKANRDEHVIGEMIEEEPDVHMIFPVKLRYNCGKRAIKRATLFPGHVFFCASRAQYVESVMQNIVGNSYVYRALHGSGSEWALVGADIGLARKSRAV